MTTIGKQGKYENGRVVCHSYKHINLNSSTFIMVTVENQTCPYNTDRLRTHEHVHNQGETVIIFFFLFFNDTSEFIGIMLNILTSMVILSLDLKDEPNKWK